MNELYEARRAILAALDGTTAIAVRVLGVSRRRGEDDPDQMLSLLADSARCLAGSLHGLLVAYDDLSSRLSRPPCPGESNLAEGGDIPF